MTLEINRIAFSVTGDSVMGSLYRKGLVLIQAPPSKADIWIDGPNQTAFNDHPDLVNQAVDFVVQSLLGWGLSRD